MGNMGHSGTSRIRTGRAARIASLILTLAVGVLFVLIGWYLYRQSTEFRRIARTTMGTVVDYRESFDDEGGSLYAPIVEYVAPGGGTVRFTDTMSTGRRSHDIGASVKVFFNPENPNSAQLDHGWIGLAFPWVFMGCGGSVILIGLVASIRSLLGGGGINATA